jgi:hypothetical protein
MELVELDVSRCFQDRKLTEIETKKLEFMHPEALKEVKNFVELEDASDQALLHVLRSNFLNKGTTFYRIADVLLHVNDVADKLKLYTPEVAAQYQLHEHDCQPHVYEFAQRMHHRMLTEQRNQTIVLLGEAGSGRETISRALIDFLRDCNSPVALSCPRTDHEKLLSQAFGHAKTVLESFGHCPTGFSASSNRIVSLISVQFSHAGHLHSGKIMGFLLGEGRVSCRARAKGEGNFNIFQQLLSCVAIDDTLRETLKMPDGSGKRLNKYSQDSHAYTYDFMNGETEFNSGKGPFRESMGALRQLGVQEERLVEVQAILAAIMHMGNMTFKEEEQKGVIKTAIDSGAEHGTAVLKRCAQLLGLNHRKLEMSLLKFKVSGTGKTLILDHRSPEQAQETCEGLARLLYAALFRWILRTINRHMTLSSKLEEWEQELEQEWKRMKDPVNAKEYYFNSATGETRWELPKELADQTQMMATAHDLDVSVLDICGFEDLKHVGSENGLEQLFVNYCNEKIYGLYLRHGLEVEMETRHADKLSVAALLPRGDVWKDGSPLDAQPSIFSWHNNLGCVAVLDMASTGFFDVLHEEVQMHVAAVKMPRNKEDMRRASLEKGSQKGKSRTSLALGQDFDKHLLMKLIVSSSRTNQTAPGLCEFQRGQTWLGKVAGDASTGTGGGVGGLNTSNAFEVKHYGSCVVEAGQVTSASTGYAVTGFVRKAAQVHTADEAMALLKQASKVQLVREMLQDHGREAAGCVTGKADKAMAAAGMAGVAASATSSEESLDAGGQVQRQLQRLLTEAGHTHHLTMDGEDEIGSDGSSDSDFSFCCCIRPNNAKSPDVFDSKLVMAQIQKLGLGAFARARRQTHLTHPTAISFPAFFRQYQVVLPPPMQQKMGVHCSDGKSLLEAMLKCDIRTTLELTNAAGDKAIAVAKKMSDKKKKTKGEKVETVGYHIGANTVYFSAAAYAGIEALRQKACKEVGEAATLMQLSVRRLIGVKMNSFRSTLRKRLKDATVARDRAKLDELVVECEKNLPYGGHHLDDVKQARIARFGLMGNEELAEFRHSLDEKLKQVLLASKIDPLYPLVAEAIAMKPPLAGAAIDRARAAIEYQAQILRAAQARKKEAQAEKLWETSIDENFAVDEELDPDELPAGEEAEMNGGIGYYGTTDGSGTDSDASEMELDPQLAAIISGNGTRVARKKQGSVAIESPANSSDAAAVEDLSFLGITVSGEQPGSAEKKDKQAVDDLSFLGITVQGGTKAAPPPPPKDKKPPPPEKRGKEGGRNSLRLANPSPVRLVVEQALTMWTHDWVRNAWMTWVEVTKSERKAKKPRPAPPPPTKQPHKKSAGTVVDAKRRPSTGGSQAASTQAASTATRRGGRKHLWQAATPKQISLC